MDVLVIQGGPGTGKTRILSETRRRAKESEAFFLRATGFPDEREIRFTIISQLAHTPGVPEGIRSSLLGLVDRAGSAAVSAKAPGAVEK